MKRFLLRALVLTVSLGTTAFLVGRASRVGRSEPAVQAPAAVAKAVVRVDAAVAPAVTPDAAVEKKAPLPGGFLPETKSISGLGKILLDEGAPDTGSSKAGSPA